MATDPVPWAVDEADHSAEVLRLVPYSAMSGAEGIIEPGNLKVRELSVPGTSVRIAAGAAAILNRSTGGSLQTYLARNVSDTNVAIAATGSSGGRSDLIVARIEDPNLSGENWPIPTTPTDGPYWFIRVISNVPAGTKRLQDIAQYANQSAITLARIDIPASTGTITNAMIKDLRKVARPRRERIMRRQTISSTIKVDTSTYKDWPTPAMMVEVPSWATHAIISLELDVGQRGGNTQGWFAMYFDYGGPGEEQLFTQQFDFNDFENAYQKFKAKIAEEVVIPAAKRGLTVDLRTRARRSAGTGTIECFAGQDFWLDIEFTQRSI